MIILWRRSSALAAKENLFQLTDTNGQWLDLAWSRSRKGKIRRFLPSTGLGGHVGQVLAHPQPHFTRVTLPLPCGGQGQPKAKGANLDRKTGVEPRKAVLTLYHLLATPAVDLVPNALALPFFRTLPTRPRGGFWDLGKPVSPYQPPRQAHREATSACPTASPGIETNRGVPVTGTKSWLDRRRARRQGPFLTVGGAFQPHWIATARLNWAAPSL